MKEMGFKDIKSGYDVVVIGAGAAGCSFLKNINSNYSVLCIDSKSFPRFKACSGILVKAGKEFFKTEKIPNWVFADSKELDLKYLDLDNNLETKSRKGFINSWRKNLDKWLFESVSSNSIDFIQNCKLLDFNYTVNKKYLVVVCEHNGEIKTFVTKYLVGCDGANSSVRKKISKNEIRYYVAIQEIIDHKFNDDAYFIFDSTITDYYGWIIPKGDVVEIGCALKPYKAKEYYNMFKEKMKKRFGVIGEGKLESAIILRPKQFSDILLGKQNIFLCGEAAGLITPSGAEGISFALNSGKICAESINENYNKDALTAYLVKSRWLLNRLKKKFEKSDILSDPKRRIKFF